MRVLVCGGRTYYNRGRMQLEMELLAESCVYNDEYHPPTIVHGDAHGADRLAAEFGKALGMVTEAHPANWNKHGKAAGPIRNKEMLDTCIDLVIAFPGGTGTADMVRRARKAGVEVREVT